MVAVAADWLGRRDPPREPSMLLEGSAREDTGEGRWKNPALLKEFACRFAGLQHKADPTIYP